MTKPKIKALLYAVLAAFTAAAAVAVPGCGTAELPENGAAEIVVTVGPVYDWVKNITEGSDGVNVRLLAVSGTDMHSFSPSVQDVVVISSADLFIYIGGESDVWAEDVIVSSGMSAGKTLALLPELGSRALEEERREGMQGEEDADEAGEPEKDEHVWLSLKNAAVLCGRICEKIAALDPANADLYRNNSERYVSGLDALDARYESTVSGSAKKTLLFGDRFPFLYLVRDYGLEYYAAFSGCSAETEASFETVVFLADKLNELGLDCVISLETSDGKLARTVIEASERPEAAVLVLDSMQSGETDYLKVMEKNLDVLKEALK